MCCMFGVLIVLYVWSVDWLYVWSVECVVCLEC